MLFEIIDSQIVLLPEMIAVKEFGDIWKKHSGSDLAFKELCYIYHSCDLASTYRSFNDKERNDVITRDIFGKDSDWEPDDMVKKAIKKYMELNRSKLSLLLEDVYTAVDSLSEYFRKVNLMEKNKFGKLIYSSKDFMSNIKMLADVVKSIKSLKKEVDKENIEVSRIRGGGDKHMDEDP